MKSSDEIRTINGVPLHFTLDGRDAAPMITFAHALFLDLRSFDPQVTAFRDTYRILRLDIRRHGRTDPDGAPFSQEDIADDVVGLLDCIGCGQTHFVGSSLGAMPSDYPVLRLWPLKGCCLRKALPGLSEVFLRCGPPVLIIGPPSPDRWRQC